MSHLNDPDEEDWELPEEADMDLDEEEAETEPCPFCRQLVHEWAEVCPHCRNYLLRQEASGRKPLWIVLVVVLCLIAILVTAFL